MQADASVLSNVQFVRRIQKVCCNLHSNFWDGSKKEQYSSLRPLILHFDEVGSLSNPKLVKLFGDPSASDDIEAIISVYYAFWSCIEPLVRMRNCFVYVSGRGSELAGMGRGQRNSPGVMRHLVLEPLQVEHIMEIFAHPILLPLAAAAVPTCTALFRIQHNWSDSERSILTQVAQLVAKLSGGVPRLISYALSFLQLRYGSVEHVQEFLKDPVIAARLLTEVMRDVPQASAFGLPRHLHDHPAVVGELVMAALTKQSFVRNKRVSIGKQKFEIAWLAGDLGLTQTLEGDQFILSAPPVHYASLVEVANMSDISQYEELRRRYLAPIDSDEKGPQLEKGIQYALVSRFLGVTCAAKQRELSVEEAFVEFQLTNISSWRMRWNPNEEVVSKLPNTIRHQETASATFLYALSSSFNSNLFY